MRKFLLRVSGFGAAIALLLCCSACRYVTGLEASYSDTSDFERSSDVKRPLLSTLINNEDSYDSLITAEVDIHDFAQKFYVDSEQGDQIFGQVSLAKIHDGIGIECLRETPEGALYSVHKVKQGGLLEVAFQKNKTEDLAFLLNLYEENFDLRDVSESQDTPYNARVFDKDRVK